MPSFVWLITGTSSGFGQRLVASALARGDRVLATARNITDLSFPGGTKDNVWLAQLDITESAQVIQSKIDKAVAHWGHVDVLVNNAGIGYPGLIEEHGDVGLRKQFETNVFGVSNVTNAILPHMRERKQGTIVIVGSRSSWKPEIPGLGPYAASKAAIRALNETLAEEIAPFGIRMLIVEPGSFRTEKIYGQGFYTGNPILDYDETRRACIKRFAAIAGTEPGDPSKGAEAIVDVVRGEGKAAGRDWPRYLILGADADRDVRNKTKKILKVLDEWEDVTKGVNFD